MKKSRIARPIAAVESPAVRSLPLVELLVDTKAELFAFGPKAGTALWARFTPHYTPKHGSWLNPAEIEASLWSRECLGQDRVDGLAAMRDRTRAWNARADRARRAITWRFTTTKARRVFRYTKRSTISRSEH